MNVSKNLNVWKAYDTLLPQTGVALGMAIKAKELGLGADIIRNITLYIFLTKIVLTKSGEIDINGITSARGEKLRNNKIQE